MRTARFFVPPEWVAKGDQVFTIPAGATHKQIVSVLRMKVNDPISLMVNDGEEIDGHITEITKSAVMGVIAGSKVTKPLRPDLVVCAAMTKRDTFEWVLQKCTELGANAFIPLLTERVVKRPKDNPKRWQDIVREAAEQSGRTTLPTLYEPMSLKEALQRTKERVQILMHESADDVGMLKVKEMDHVALFIGPEGGFSPAEVDAAKLNGAHIVKLGDTVLRAETAAIVGTTLLRFR